MKISDLFSRAGVYGNSKVGAGSKQENENSNARGGVDSDSDRTSISAKALLLAQVARVRDDQEEKQAQRILNLKRQIEAGEYNISGREVASRIVEFLGERV